MKANSTLTFSLLTSLGCLPCGLALAADLTGPHEVVWSQTAPGANNAYAESKTLALAIDGAGNPVVGGGTENFYTAKRSGSTGDLLWEKIYDGPSGYLDYARAVAVDVSGNVIVTGASYGNNANAMDIYTAKYAAAAGSLLWEKRRAGGGGSFYTEEGKAVAIDASGDVVIAGALSGKSTGLDIYVAKYNGATGALLWEKTYNGTLPKQAYDYATSVAVDTGGNVIVSGTTESKGTYDDLYTAKYNGTTGALIWKQTSDGSGLLDGAVGLALDASGNAVVSGFTTSSGNRGRDFYTTKYAASNGQVLWKITSDGGRTYDEPEALVVDAVGNAIITGWTEAKGDADGYYFTTVKYAASNGAVLWKQNDSSANYKYQQAKAIAVDGSGNVVVTGYSGGAGALQTDILTVAYSGGNGEELWENRFTLPGKSGEYPYAIKLDAQANVFVTGSNNSSLAQNWITLKISPSVP